MSKLVRYSWWNIFFKGYSKSQIRQVSTFVNDDIMVSVSTYVQVID